MKRTNQFTINKGNYCVNLLRKVKRGLLCKSKSKIYYRQFSNTAKPFFLIKVNQVKTLNLLRAKLLSQMT